VVNWHGDWPFDWDGEVDWVVFTGGWKLLVQVSGLGWNLPDTEHNISFHWDGHGFLEVILGISRGGAWSSGTGGGESGVNFAIWDIKFEAESGFNPVDWGGGSGLEVLEV